MADLSLDELSAALWLVIERVRLAEQRQRAHVTDRKLEVLAQCYATAVWLSENHRGPGTRGAPKLDRGGAPKVDRRIDDLVGHFSPADGPDAESLYTFVMRVALELDWDLRDREPGTWPCATVDPLGGRVYIRLRVAHHLKALPALRAEWRDHRRVTYDDAPRHHLWFHEIWWEPAERTTVTCYSDDDPARDLLQDTCFNPKDADKYRAFRIALCPLPGAPIGRLQKRQVGASHRAWRFSIGLGTSAVEYVVEVRRILTRARAAVGTLVLPELMIPASVADDCAGDGCGLLWIAGSWHVGVAAPYSNRAPVRAQRVSWDHDKKGVFHLRGAHFAHLPPPLPAADEQVFEDIEYPELWISAQHAVWGRCAVAICADVLTDQAIARRVLGTTPRVDTLFVPSFSPETDGFEKFAIQAAQMGTSIFYVNAAAAHHTKERSRRTVGAVRPEETTLAFVSLALDPPGRKPIATFVRLIARDHERLLQSWDGHIWVEGAPPGFEKDEDLGLVFDLNVWIEASST